MSRPFQLQHFVGMGGFSSYMVEFSHFRAIIIMIFYIHTQEDNHDENIGSETNK